MDEVGQPKEPEPDQGLKTRKRALENDDDDEDDGEEHDHDVAEGQEITKKVAKINSNSGKERQFGIPDPRTFDHALALERINRDFLGPDPALSDEDFKRQFKISRTSFQRLKDDVLKSNILFYEENDIKTHPSVEAKLLLPLHSCGYGVPFYAFMDYFEMSLHQAHEACKEFEVALLKLYVPERVLHSDGEEEDDEEREFVGHILRDKTVLTGENEVGVKLALKRLKKLGFSTLGLM